MAESNAFPWLKHLPEEDAIAFFKELWERLDDFLMDPGPGSGVSAEGFVKNLDPMIHAWKATAEVHGDPALHKALTQPMGGDFGKVPQPGLLFCGLCYLEDGEEIHPHPECKVKYSRGSIITVGGRQGAVGRRWKVLEVRGDQYRVKSLFGSMEPSINLWNIDLCQEITSLEWQEKPEREGVINAHGYAVLTTEDWNTPS